MKVLIVESQRSLARLWQRHLERLGAEVWLSETQIVAGHMLSHETFDVIILDLMLDSGNALSVADLAQYRQPEARVVFVTNTSFFSDGSIFQVCANACAFLPSGIPPADLATMVEHYAGRAEGPGLTGGRV